MNKTILHPYIPAMVNNVEEWLSQMSDKGLTLIYMNGWKFVFQDTQKSEKKEYFIYSGFDASTGFSYDFYRAKEKYGIMFILPIFINGFLTVAGGIVITFAKEILDLIVG